MKILYVVSSLKSGGPTNQLFNIISNLPADFDVRVLTLSMEEGDSQLDRFEKVGVDVKSLNLTRLRGLLIGRKEVFNVIQEFSPDIIHSHGLRPDTMLGGLNLTQPWVMTSRNYPYADYPMKFGKLRGYIMAFFHLAAMRKCPHLVSCSKSIASELGKHGVKSKVIQNGVAFTDNFESVELQASKPIFITVGSLIKRKNTAFVIEAFNKIRKHRTASLFVLGDGLEAAELKSMAGEDVYFTGNVDNVRAYLLQADYFVSASLSEGLPNTVLEALAAGLPSLLSDIPSHREIALEDENCITIFQLNQGCDDLVNKMQQVDTLFTSKAKNLALNLALGTFSAAAMSKKYQQLYASAKGADCEFFI